MIFLFMISESCCLLYVPLVNLEEIMTHVIYSQKLSLMYCTTYHIYCVDAESLSAFLATGEKLAACSLDNVESTAMAASER